VSDDAAPPVDDDPRFRPGDAVLATVGAIVVGAVFGGIVVGLAGYESFDDAPIPVLVLAQVPLWAGLVGIPWLVSRRRGSGSLVRDLGLRMHWTDVPVGLGVGVATQLLVLLLIPVYEALGVDPDEIGESAQQLGDKADDPLTVALLVLMAVVGAAVAEEICYRGLWIRALGRYGRAVAVVVSSLVFAAVHFEPLTIPPLFVFGAVAALLVTHTGRLGPAIWAHVGFNALAVAALVAG
jgi:membrane protease YdiL (CAAX protease family)